jgi:RNA polymerase sigma-70 factor (ECF subfamily)
LFAPRLVGKPDKAHDTLMPLEPLPPSLDGAGQFRTTRWSMVYRAGARQCSAEEGHRALEELCRAYWRPLHAYVQRQGYSPEDAQDLTQEFFSRLLQDRSLASVDAAKGRFRSFLLASIKHLLANEWKRATRQKRGGGAVHFSIEEELAGGHGVPELIDNLDPEKAFEKRWAETLLRRVLDRLRDEWEDKDNSRHFDELKPFLIEGRGAMSLAEAAARAEVSEASLKWAVHKLRQRYRELVREEIAHTVNSDDEIEDELRYLFSVLAN